MLIIERFPGEIIRVEDEPWMLGESTKSYCILENQGHRIRIMRSSDMMWGDLTIKLLASDKDKAKLGFIAPSHIKIYREEIYPFMRDKDGLQRLD